MDGHFVPNISMGAPIIRSLRRATRLPLEAHLMISDPDFFVDEFAQAGTDRFLVHWEGNHDLSRTVQLIKALGKRVGVAINPATPATFLEEIIQDLDQVLIMTVNPGFGHQHFLHTTLPNIGRAISISPTHPFRGGAVQPGGSRKSTRVAGWGWTRVSLWHRPRSGLLGAPTFWCPGRKFQMTGTASPPPWKGCGPQPASKGEA